ncbi:putative Ig domain-containing protein [Teredinibacter sp. KSP-S5-2]|uniref:putative Ig domain-containing protein n=1 Tax=Teredinibacter sp. KSP-S5-2 TaxID=3034506 RepID=UPI00293478CD|nr:putative Ig domain-containing protein [Teredinibacter sp. KSP-S5-2]WNO11572.1 putative Ig domain-containing protein [Teredinibacter sp. KSP-S5-2]
MRFIRSVRALLMTTVVPLLSAPFAHAQYSPVSADVVVVIDESGSMSGEQRWLSDAIPSLETSLKQYGIGSEAQPNLYGLVGFGNSRVVPRSINVGDDLLGSASEFVTASSKLVVNGGTEDGWRGIQYAIDQYPRRNGAVLNVILATDEDRDNTDRNITFQSVLDSLTDSRALLNAVINVNLRCEDGTTALGMDSTGVGYVEDGQGGFTTCVNPRAINGSGASISHYVDMAMQNGGAVWSLNRLRAGGLTAQSFTKALLAVKVDEILSQKPVGDLVAVAQATPNPAVAGQTVALDGANSYHLVDGRAIVNWEWDFDNDGVFDASGPIASTSFPELGKYPVVLRVTDDAATPQTASTTVLVDVSTPPLKPTANAGGPYSFCPQYTPWQLNGAGSINPDDGQSEPGLPGDQIVSYQWDLNNDLVFGDLSGSVVDASAQLQALGVGDHLIRLRVTDNTAESFPSSGQSDLSDIAVTQVRVRDAADALCNCLADLAARPKMTKIQLTWTDSGAAKYAVYRSLNEGGPYERVATTDSRYSTYLDLGLELDTPYFYYVEELSLSGQPVCRSREVTATPTARRFNLSNRAPSFTSQPVLSAQEGSLYTYDAEATDPDARERLEFALQVAPTGMTVDATTGVINWTPINAQVGQQTVILRVTDNQGAFAEQVFTVTVSNVNQAPVISSSPVTSATELQAYSYQVIAVDPDLGDSLSYRLSTAPQGMTINAQGAISWTPTVGQAGTQSVTVVVEDAAGLSDTQNFSISVEERNLAPTIDSSPVTQAVENTLYQYQVTAIDGNGDALTYALGQFPPGMTIEPLTGLVSWTPTTEQIGTHDIIVVVSDTRGGSGSQSFTVTVAEQNVAPVFTTQTLDNATEDTAYRFTVLASDPNAGDVLSFSKVNGPAALQIDSANGEISWLPVNNNVGDNSVTLRVTDADGLFVEQTFTINVANTNDMPAITSEPVQTAQRGQQYSYQVLVTDPDVGDVISYSLNIAPQGMSISTAGLITWTPTQASTSPSAVEVVVNDLSGAADQQNFAITIANSNPQITSTSPASVGETQTYSYQVVASDSDGDALTYSLANAPQGMSVDSVSGMVQWPTALGDQGTYSFTISVSDGVGGSTSEAVSLQVTPRVNTAPVIQSSPALRVVEDSLYSYQVVANDAENDPISFSLSSAPAGMQISQSGSLSWTPSQADIGAHPVVIEVTDGLLTSNQSFTLTVEAKPNLAPTISSTPLNTVQIDTQYQYQVEASDPESDSLTYALAVSPQGMSISATGLVQWLPGIADVGIANVVVRVTDSASNYVEQSFGIAVTEQPNTAPEITSTPAQNAQENIEYQYQVTATDAEADALTYSLVSGPSGMSMTNGLLVWLPSFEQIGVHSVQVRVVDSRLASATQTFSIVVSAQENQLPVILSSPLTTVVEGEAYRYAVQAVDGNADPLSYALTRAPAGMSVDSAGVITWAAGAPGNYPVQIRVSDTRGGAETQSYVLSVTSASGNTAPFIDSSPVTKATPGFPYAYAVKASDVDGDTLAYSLVEGPSGLAISGDGVVSWKPSATGNYDVTLSVSDGQAVSSQNYTIAVTDQPTFASPLDVTIVVSPQIVNPGQQVTVQVVAEGGRGDVAVLASHQGQPLTLVNGVAILAASAESGRFELSATASDSRDSVISKTYYTVSNSADATAPEALISAPATDSEIANRVAITGTANDDNLAHYRVLMRLKGQNGYEELAYGLTPVVNGELAVLEPLQYPAGLYDLILEVVDVNGVSSLDNITLDLTEDVPVGSFSMTLSDMNISLPGIPVAVKRTYDSRLKGRSLDFGHGWAVDYQDLNVQTNTVMGNNWAMSKSGGFIPTYCVEPASAHYVKIKLPGRRSMRFNATAQNNCQTLYPPRNVDLAYNAAPGTEASLVSDGAVALFYNAGQLLDGDFAPYEPRRYTLTTNDGYVYRLDQSFGVQSVKGPNGNQVNFGYNGITHSSGAGVAFTRDGQGRITKITDPAGDSVDYFYSAKGDLAAVRDREGSVVQYQYNRNHGLTDVIDPSGLPAARNIYNDAGQIVEVIDSEGNSIAFEHSTDSNTEIVRDQNGNPTVYAYDDSGNVTSETNAMGHTQSFGYDTAGNRTSVTNALGHTTTSSYDVNGNQTSLTDPLGNTITRAYSSTGALTSMTDANGNTVTNTVDASGNVTESLDALGNVTANSFNAQGALTSTKDALGNTTTYTINALGKVATTTDALGNVETLGYDANGRETSSSRSRTDIDGNTYTVVKRKEYDRNGRVLAEVDAEGGRWEKTYDASGQVATEKDPNGNETKHFYDSNGNRIRTEYADGTSESWQYDIVGNKVSSTNRAGHTTTHEYDVLGRLVKETYADGTYVEKTYDALGNVLTETDENGQVRSYEYDAAGRKTAEINALLERTTFAYDGNGNLISKTDPLGRVTRYEYDALDRKLATRYADGTAVSQTLDAIGQILSETDQAGKTTQFEYDVRGKLVAVTDAIGSVTRFEYDEVGNKVAQIDAEGRITRWSYDNEGRVLTHTLPGGGVESFTYDANGNQLSHTDFAGQTSTFVYDSNNKLIEKTLPDGSVERFTYTPTGNVATTSNATATVTYTYDLRDRPVRVEYSSGAYIAYTYDAAGNQLSKETNAGATSYGYDALNRLVTVTDANAGVTSYTYDAVGNRSSVTHANGTVARYTYDNLDRLTSLVNETSAGQVISSYAYTLGLAGNRLKVVEHSGREVTYAYDDVYRLVSESVKEPAQLASVTEYTYDRVGNRLTKVVDGLSIGYTYSSDDQMLSEGVVQYEYDLNGNRVAKITQAGRVEYGYDGANRLVSTTQGGQTSGHAYDAMSNRIQSSVGGQTTTYLIDPTFEHAKVVAELGSGNTVIASYTYGDDLVSQVRNAVTRYYHFDGQGSTRALTDATQTVTDTYSYEAFGKLTNRTGSSVNTFLFNAEQLDPNTGFYYLRARFYDAETGRFITRDSFPGWKFDPPSLHKYNYTHNDPVNRADPSGKFVSIGFIGGLTRGINLALSRVGIGFAISRAMGGAALRALGMVVENAVGRILARIPGVVLQRGVTLVGNGGRRVIDFWAQVGSRVALIEVKYGLPRTTGAAMTRLVGQMQTSLSAGNGAQVVLFTFRAPSAAQMNLLLTQLGPQAGAIQHVSGLWGLVQWARFFFLLP